MWYPGYMGFMASNHNGMLRMYETFGNGGANTMKRRIGGGAEGGMGAGGGQVSREWYRPLPPYAEVEWSLRNNTNYMQTGVLSALELTAAACVDDERAGGEVGITCLEGLFGGADLEVLEPVPQGDHVRGAGRRAPAP
jgi:hypothetical protein